MQCPLCRESVADDNALQIHYLVSCLGYLENTTSNKSSEAVSPRSRKQLVQFRWVKSKPTLAREVYLISSLAGSVKLEWRDIEECFLSDQVEVPQGLHLCQLVVDGDSMSTDDFNVSDTSRTIDVLVPEASLAEGSTGNLSEDETHVPQSQPASRRNQGNNQDETESDVQTRDDPQKSSLYQELIKHQILHGDSLGTLTGTSREELGENSGYQRERGNGLAVGNPQHQRNKGSQDIVSAQPLKVLTGVRTDSDDNARPGFNIADLRNDRQRTDVLRDSMSSDELQQFLQPTRRSRQESEASAGREDNDNATTEERESSLSDNEENSVSVSSHEGFERRPELLGQSNGENESRVQFGAARRDMSNHVQGVDSEGARAQSSVDHRQETLLIDLRETSSGNDREGSSSSRREILPDNDRKRLLDDSHEHLSSSDPRRSSGNYRISTSSGREQSSVSGRQELSGERHESLSSARRKHSSGDREKTSRSHPRYSGSHSDGIIAETSGGYRDNRNRSSGGNREATSNVRRTSDDYREEIVRETDGTSGRREPSGVLRTEISGDLRQETTSGLQEKTSTAEHEPKSDDTRERSDDRREASDGGRDTSEGGREVTLGCEVTSTGREDIPESITRDNRNISDEGTSPVSTTSYSSLPTRLSPGITLDAETEALINSLRISDTRVALQENRSLFVQEGISTGNAISPRGSVPLADNLGPENETGGHVSTLGSTTSVTGARDSGAGTSSVLSPKSSATVFTRSHSLDGGTAKTTTTADDLLFRSYSSTAAALRATSRDESAPSRDGSDPSRDRSTPIRDGSAPSRDGIAPNRDESTPGRDGSAPSKDGTAPSRDGDASIRDASAPSGDRDSPSSDANGRSRDAIGLSNDESAPSRGGDSPSRDGDSPSRDGDSPSRDGDSPSSDANAPSREKSAPRTEESAPSRSHNRQRVSNFSGGENYRAFSRRDPQGSFLDDSDIRRPPLYTSAPSRPYSSLPYSPHVVVSPLTSPRDGEVVVSSVERPGPNADATSNKARVASLAPQSILDRQTPTGSAQRPEGAQAVGGGSTSSSKQFSEDSVKELLDSLKRTSSSRRNNSCSPETSPRERLGTSEVSALKNRLAEREEALKKLKAKNTAYKKELREREIELTEALSLTESSQAALKEQEEIAGELTNALSEKEKQYAALEAKVYEMKRERHRLESEAEQERKDYEKKILELRSIYASLDKEVKTLRQRPVQTSLRQSDEYKELQEDCLESMAVSASLKDQLQKLEKENKDLKEKLNILSKTSRQEDLSKYTRDVYTSHTHRGLGTSRQEHSNTSINGYADTNLSPTSSRQHYDGLRVQSDTLQQRFANDPYQPFSTNPYDSHRPVIENIRYQSESTEHRRERSRPQSEPTRTQFNSQTENSQSRYEGLRDHSDILRNRSDVYGSESFQPRESRNRRRGTTADDMPSSGISDGGFRHSSSRRSRSSDSLRNRIGFPDGTQSSVSPSQERGGLDRGQHSGREQRTHLARAGSFDNLTSRHTTSTSSNLALTGHRIDFSPTSPPSKSPRSDRRSSPGKGSPFAPHTPQEIDQGMIVLVSRTLGRLSKGVVRYIGYLPDKRDKVYLGLELHDKDGKHDGKFNEQRFFKCKPNHGIFVPFEKVVMAYT